MSLDVTGNAKKTCEENAIEEARKYVLQCYTSNIKSDVTLDDLCLVMASTTNRPAAWLPPTEDVLLQHLKRAQVQTQIWQTSHIAKQKQINLVGNSWVLKDDKQEPTLMENEPAPVELRDIIHLFCKDKNCSASKCKYLASGLLCIDICECTDCENKNIERVHADNYDTSGEDDV